MPLSEKRRHEIMRLVYEGGEELTQAIALGEPATERHLAAIRREITDFLKTCTDTEELDFFAENWTRDGREGPIHELIQNPHADAGTLLRLYWYSDPEFYYSQHRAASELDDGTDRDIFATLEGIEERIVQAAYETASIPFDPRDHVTMRDRHPTFARPIPELMFRPIRGSQE
jgi:hypothetical protein